MKKFTILFYVLLIPYMTFAQEDVIAVIQEPFVVLLDPEDGSVIDNQFIDLTPLNQGTPKDIVQVGNELWISDQIEDRIDRFDIDGNYLSTIGTGLDNIKGMEIVDDEVWVTNAGSNNGAPDDAIVRFDFDGNNLGFYTTSGDSSFDIIDVGSNEVYISYIGSGSRIERRDYDGNVLGNVVGTGIVTFIQQMEINDDNNSVYASVFSSNGPNTAGLYEFSRTDGSILNSWQLGSLRGVAQLEDGNILISGGTNFGIQILDPATGNTTNVNSTDSAQYFTRISLCTPPATPTGNPNQTFNQGATVDDIVVDPVGVTWFATEADALANENPLPGSTLLEDDETYYAVNIIDDCLSVPFAVTVEILLSTNDLDKDQVSLYPNPASNIVIIRATNSVQKVSIVNIVGQRVFESAVNKAQFEIDVTSLNNGVYFVLLESETGTRLVKRLIKE